MRRTLSVLLATVAGLVLLANFHTSPALTAPAAAGGTAPTPTTAQPAAGGPPFGRGGDGGPFTVPTTAAPATTAPPTTATPAAGDADRVVDGPVEENRYGPVQVRVTLSGNRIVDVQALELPTDRSRSYQISQTAGPILRQETLAAQNAQIHTVSGATYTSTGYRQSLQAALDQAGHR
ncbi:MAG TPA: FMN-binding protein [Acidimicrobiales bacterium]|nr:FMN-binding protein [Acidimicrobiales bacterium]